MNQNDNRYQLLKADSVFHKINSIFIIESSNPTSMYFSQWNMSTHEHTSVFTGAYFIIATSTERWIKTLWFIHTMENSSSLKRMKHEYSNNMMNLKTYKQVESNAKCYILCASINIFIKFKKGQSYNDTI